MCSRGAWRGRCKLSWDLTPRWSAGPTATAGLSQGLWPQVPAPALPQQEPRAACLPAVEVRGFLSVELAVSRAAVLGGSEALEAIVDELRIFLVEVLVRHHVGRACVHLVTAHLCGPDHSQGAEAQYCWVTSELWEWLEPQGLNSGMCHL